ncbi:hypothetical protein ACGC1H_005869 [Rhizoctonia solani]
MSTIPDPHTAKNDFIAKFQAPTWRQVDDPRPTSDRRRALVIAISYAPGIVPPQLSGTYADANNVILMLEKFGYQKSDICVLADIEIRTENAAGITPDKSRMPDRDNIVKAIQWLGENSGDHQNRFLYFSGHGHIQHYPTSDGNRSCEGLFPCDVQFKPLQRCVGCVCEDNYWDIISDSNHKELERRMPSLLSVLWDYNLNLLLTRVIMPGTKFTVCLPCCHSGGTLETVTQIKPGYDLTEMRAKGRTSHGVDTGRPISKSTGGDIQDLPYRNHPVNNLPNGNFLGLPIGLDLVLPTIWLAPEIEIPGSWQTETSTLPEPHVERRYQDIAARGGGSSFGAKARSSTTDDMKTCAELQIAGQLPMIAFHDTCQIMCWAACRRLERAWENGEGLFTSVFTRYVAAPTNPGNLFEPSYEGLIGIIKSKFESYNNKLTPSYAGRKQHPKLFVSANLDLGQHLHQKPDI